MSPKMKGMLITIGLALAAIAIDRKFNVVSRVLGPPTAA